MLCMCCRAAGRMAQRHKHLTRTAPLGPHIIFDDGVTAAEPTFSTEPFKNAFCSVASLARASFVFSQPMVNLIRIRIQLRALDHRCSPIPRRFRIRPHLRYTISADPKFTGNLPPARTILKMGEPHLQIQIHGENPHTLPTIERAKVADFYAARDTTMTPLPWPSIDPPFTGLLRNVKRVSKQGSPLPIRHMRAAVPTWHQPGCGEKRDPDE